MEKSPNQQCQDMFRNIVPTYVKHCCGSRVNFARFILVVISWTFTVITKPDQDDYEKLARVMKYFQGTINLELKIIPSTPVKAVWWVDAAYATNDGMYSHTGGVMGLGEDDA